MTAKIENCSPVIDNEGIKAIRFCCGYSTDLRIILNKRCYFNKIRDFIEKNGIYIFGSEFCKYDIWEGCGLDQIRVHEDLVDHAASMVCGCYGFYWASR